jgi:hypothetical protein
MKPVRTVCGQNGKLLTGGFKRVKDKVKLGTSHVDDYVGNYKVEQVLRAGEGDKKTVTFGR